MAVLKYFLFILLFALIGCNRESGEAADPLALVGGDSVASNPGTKFSLTLNKLSNQENPTSLLPIKFRVNFSRVIDPAGFTKTDIIFTGSATGIEFDLIQINSTKFYINVTAITIKHRSGTRWRDSKEYLRFI